MKYTPRPYQGLISDFQLDHDRCAVFGSMGVGKTSSTLATLDHLYGLGFETRPTLILAPLRVARSTWPDEAEKWGFGKVIPIVGTQNQRAMALRQDAPYFSINYENLPWLVDWFKHNPRPWPFGTIVADESTKLKSYRSRQGGMRAQALASIAHTKIDRFISLTGTPAPNGLQDLWGQMWFIDKGERLGKTFSAFSGRWFQNVPAGNGFTRLKAMPHAQEQIQETLRDICITIDAKDWFDIKEPIVNKIMVTMPHKAKQLYKTMEKEMFIELEGGDVEAFNAASKTIKCRQLANGAIYLDASGKFEEVHDEKLCALDEIIEEAAGMPVLVAYNFKSDLVRLTRAFPKGRVLDSDPQTIKDWNAGKIPVLFAHPASAGHGISLQDGGNIIVYFGVDWNLENHQQVLERIGPTRQIQAGYDRPVFVYYILTAGTVDTLIMERLTTKRETQDILLEAMNNYKRGKR